MSEKDHGNNGSKNYEEKMLESDKEWKLLLNILADSDVVGTPASI